MIRFFDPEVRKVCFVNSKKTRVPINLAPEKVGDMDLQFTVRLVVPAAAMLQGIVLGEPNVATVIVPGSIFGMHL